LHNIRARELIENARRIRFDRHTTVAAIASLLVAIALGVFFFRSALSSSALGGVEERARRECAAEGVTGAATDKCVADHLLKTKAERDRASGKP
jgi:hypothetical protein